MNYGMLYQDWNVKDKYERECEVGGEGNCTYDISMQIFGNKVGVVLETNSDSKTRNGHVA